MKTKYYQVSHAVEAKVIGRRYPQITHSTGGYWKVMDPESAYGQLAVWNSPTADPPIGFLNLAKGAKATDILSASMFSHYGFLMSPKAKSVFEQHNLGKNWFFPVEVVHKETSLQYFILHTNNDYIDDIDWERTEFSLSTYSIERNILEIQKIIKIKDKEELFYLLDHGDARNRMYLNAYQIYLNEKFDNTRDMVAFYRISLGGTLISEKLMNALIENGITGIYYKKLEVFEKWENE